MELRHLRYFVTVAQEQSFTKAADKLFTVQPSLSQQIKDLEQEVGVSLFDRGTRKISLTAEGEAFLIYAKEALENAKRAVAAARQVAQNKTNQIHMGLLNVAEIKVMPSILVRLKQDFPNINIHLYSLTCLEQVQKLKNSELDICFTRLYLDHPDFENIQLMQEQIYLVAHQSLHLKDRIIKLKELKNHTLIMCEKNASPVFYDKINDLISFDQQQHEQMLWVTNVMQHLNLINMGMGFSFVPEYLLKFLSPEIKVIPCDVLLPKLSIYASFSRMSKNMALQRIIDICAQSHSS